MKRILTYILAIFIAMSSATCTTVYAEENLLGYVESTAPYILNLRSGPGLNYEVIGDFPRGAIAEWIGVSGGWYLVTCDGVTGYCAAEYTISATEDDYNEYMGITGTPSSADTSDTTDTDETTNTDNANEAVESDVDTDKEETDSDGVDLSLIEGLYNSTNPSVDPEQSEYNTCQILTKISIPDELFDDDLYIMIYNLDLDNYYKINLNEDNDWTGNVWVPVGSYEIIEINCETNEYYEFSINNGLSFSFADEGESYTISGTYSMTFEGSVAEDEDEDEDILEDAVETTEEEEEENSEIYPWREVSRSGSGPMISYDGLSTGNYSIKIEILHSGGIGEATYQISYDGGSTYEDTTEITSTLKLTYTDSDGNEVDTGLTAYFPDDTYSIGTVYSFSTTTEWESESNSSTGSIMYVTGLPEVDKTYELEVVIIESGELGSATYQYTYDGESWSDESITPSSGIVSLSSGITFRLYGEEYMAGDSFTATVIGVAPEEAVDHTYMIYGIVLGSVAAVFIVLFMFFFRKRKGKNEYELIR